MLPPKRPGYSALWPPAPHLRANRLRHVYRTACASRALATAMLAWLTLLPLAPAQAQSLSVGNHKPSKPANAQPLPSTKPADSAPVSVLDGPVKTQATIVAATGEKEHIRFEADKVQDQAANDQNASETVTATGNVVLRREDQTVRADQVTWNRKTGQIIATGNIRLVDEAGNVLYTERVELTDELKAGMIDNLLLVLREGGRLAAGHATREANGIVQLSSASYTGCAVEDSNGCPRRPSWQITAVRVSYNPADKHVRYYGAVFHLFGLGLLPLPGLVHTLDNRAENGLLVPDIKSSAANGLEFIDSYYLRFNDNRDLTISGYLFTNALPMVSARFRQ